MTLRSGSKFGRYEIQQPLGSGGMGEVYSAWDPVLQRTVAVKILPQDFAAEQERRSRFELEARAAGAINHPHIIVIHDVGFEENSPFIVSELLEGESLREAIRKGIPVRTAVSYAIQIASGLAAAHERSIIHRDLKPENIFITKDGIVKILDFGVAKDTAAMQDGNSDIKTITQPGMLLGTIAYMSPEQARRQFMDARSDIFSFGTILCEMLTGKNPFQSDSSVDYLLAIVRDEPDFSVLSKRVSPELIRILMHCLEKDPANRFQSSRDLGFALRIVEASLLQPDKLFTSSASTTVESEEAPSIAVLPFADMTPQKDQEYFCDGIAEELITALTKIEGLRVASRTSAFQFKSQQLDIRRIGQQLNVKTILDGSVRKSGKRVRITADLINVADGYHVWSEKYDRDLEDVFSIQDEIAHTIVETLRGHLISTKPLVRRYTEDQEAYNLYLKGRYHWNRRYQEGVSRAVEYFQEAIDKDPSYALAYSGLADCYSILGFYAFEPPAEMYLKAKAAAEKALELDPNLPEGHLSMGAVVYYFENRWEEGGAFMVRSLELNPDFGLGHCWYTGFLSLTKRNEEALIHIRKALQLDPLSPLFCSFSSLVYLNMHQFDRAIQEAQKALEIDPTHMLAVWYMGLAYSQKQMHEQSLRFMRKACEAGNRTTFLLSYLGRFLADAGQVQEAEEILNELTKRSASEYVAPLSLARILLGLKRFDEVFQEIHRAINEKNVMIYLIASPEWDPLRSDPRFAEVLRLLNWTQ